MEDKAQEEEVTHRDHQSHDWEKHRGLHPFGSVPLFSSWEKMTTVLIKMGTSLKDVFDSPQRSRALAFPFCLSQDKCLLCRSEIRSRVVPACFTKYLSASIFAPHNFSVWPCYGCSHPECSFCWQKTPRQSPEWTFGRDP